MTKIYIAEYVDLEDDEDPVSEIGIFSEQPDAYDAVLEHYKDTGETENLQRLEDADPGEDIFCTSEDVAEYWFYRIREAKVK